jgi:hypothetical protein
MPRRTRGQGGAGLYAGASVTGGGTRTITPWHTRSGFGIAEILKGLFGGVEQSKVVHYLGIESDQFCPVNSDTAPSVLADAGCAQSRLRAPALLPAAARPLSCADAD